MSNEKLRPWPDFGTFVGLRDATKFGDQWAYERQRADAAMERLKLAVDALTDTAKAGYVAAQYMGLGPRPSHQKQVSDALLKAGRVLAAIDMPKEGA